MPSKTAIRRRRAALAAAAVAALVAGLSLGAGHEDTPRPQAARPPAAAPTAAPKPRAAEALTLRQQVGKLIVLRFNGTTLPAYVKRILRNGWAAGVILFRDNVADPQQLRRLTADVRRAAGKPTPIICTDQEGGAIRNLTWAPPANAQAAQDPGPDATAAAKALKSEGLNVTLAPVADVPSVAGAALAGRAFPGDAAQAVAAAVGGWRAGGVAPTAKHFPGLGGATVNTDQGSATISGGAPTEADLAPFEAAIRAHVPLIMASHARYPRLDPDHIASQSPAILQTLLRRQLGYRGVVMTDSIEAAAVRATGATEQVAVRSIAAGEDIVLTTGQGSWIHAFRALLAQAQGSRAFRTRVKDSAARVIALQRTLS